MEELKYTYVIINIEAKDNVAEIIITPDSLMLAKKAYMIYTDEDAKK